MCFTIIPQLSSALLLFNHLEVFKCIYNSFPFFFHFVELTITCENHRFSS